MFYDNFHLLLVLEKSLPTVSGLENQTNQHTLVGLQFKGNQQNSLVSFKLTINMPLNGRMMRITQGHDDQLLYICPESAGDTPLSKYC